MTWTSAVRIVGAAGLTGLLLSAFTPVPNLVSLWMSGARPLEEAGAVVVLGAGGVRQDGTLTITSLRRTLHGLTLHRRGLAPLLVFSGSPRDEGGTEAELRARMARECGVRPDVIVTDSGSLTTRDESVRIGAILLPKGIRRILLVADAEGMGRAARVFEKAGFQVIPAPTDDVTDLGGSPEDRLQSTRRIVMELVGWLYYRMAGYI
jgi:uncharacterized SAM-binding protein YcdF (DUF218 family)